MLGSKLKTIQFALLGFFSLLTHHCFAEDFNAVKKAASFKTFNSLTHHNPAQGVRWSDTDLSMYGFENTKTHPPHTTLWDYGTWNQEGCAGSSTNVDCEYAETVDAEQVLAFASTLEDGSWVFLDIEFLDEM